MAHQPKPPNLPRASPITESARQAVLDAAAILQVRRSEIAAQLASGPIPEAEVVAVGESINHWMLKSISDWHELLSVRPSATVGQLRISVPNNRYLVEHGLEMVSLFDYLGIEPGGRTLLANETLGTYLFGVAPVQMKIGDRRFVLLTGPDVDGQPSVMRVTARHCMDAAWRYWGAAVASAIPVAPTKGRGALTPRQDQVIGLLAADLGDEAIADALGVSVRTVRSEIAAILDSLGVRSRFAAAARLQLGSDELD